MKDEHTPEPWRASDYVASLASGIEQGACVMAGDDTLIDLPFGPEASWPEATQRANARRIVACVNACAGIPTEVLEAWLASEPQSHGYILQEIDGLDSDTWRAGI